MQKIQSNGALVANGQIMKHAKLAMSVEKAAMTDELYLSPSAPIRILPSVLLIIMTLRQSPARDSYPITRTYSTQSLLAQGRKNDYEEGKTRDSQTVKA